MGKLKDNYENNSDVRLCVFQFQRWRMRSGLGGTTTHRHTNTPTHQHTDTRLLALKLALP